MGKARKRIKMLNEKSSTDFEAFRKNVKKVRLKRDGRWYRVKDVVFDKGIGLVGYPDRVYRDEIADVMTV